MPSELEKAKEALANAISKCVRIYAERDSAMAEFDRKILDANLEYLKADEEYEKLFEEAETQDKQEIECEGS